MRTTEWCLIVLGVAVSIPLTLCKIKKNQRLRHEKPSISVYLQPVAKRAGDTTTGGTFQRAAGWLCGRGSPFVSEKCASTRDSAAKVPSLRRSAMTLPVSLG